MYVIVHVPRIQCSSAVIGLDDWILDVCWLGRERSGDSSFRVAAVTAHNTVVICTGCEGSGGGDGGAHQSNPATAGLWGTRDVPQYHCEVNCILYPIPLAAVQSLTPLASQWYHRQCTGAVL